MAVKKSQMLVKERQCMILILMENELKCGDNLEPCDSCLATLFIVKLCTRSISTHLRWISWMASEIAIAILMR